MEETAILWGNMSIHNLQRLPGRALWVFDNSLLDDNEPIVAFDGFGAMRAEITAHLWRKLGLRDDYQKGWLQEKATPQTSWIPRGISVRRQADQCILAQRIHPNIVQCTVDEYGRCIKQTGFTLGGKKTNLEESAVFVSLTTIEETRKRSEEIANRLRNLCETTGVIGMSGMRISWGITVENEILTPVGGIGLQDHTRYFLRAKGPKHFLDRRALKDVLRNYRNACSLRRAAIIQVRSRYEVMRAMLISQ